MPIGRFVGEIEIEQVNQPLRNERIMRLPIAALKWKSVRMVDVFRKVQI